MLSRIRWYWILAALVVYEWGRASTEDRFQHLPWMLIGILVYLVYFTLLDLQRQRDDERRD